MINAYIFILIWKIQLKLNFKLLKPGMGPNFFCSKVKSNVQFIPQWYYQFELNTYYNLSLFQILSKSKLIAVYQITDIRAFYHIIIRFWFYFRIYLEWSKSCSMSIQLLTLILLNRIQLHLSPDQLWPVYNKCYILQNHII